MPNSAPRSLPLAAAAAVLVSAGTDASAGSAQGHDGAFRGDVVATLVHQSEVANAALMRGDIDGYRALIKITDDYTLMSPFGGTPTRASAMTDERWEAIGRYFRNGTFKQDVVQTYASDDMVVLAAIEHAPMSK